MFDRAPENCNVDRKIDRTLIPNDPRIRQKIARMRKGAKLKIAGCSAAMLLGISALSGGCGDNETGGNNETVACDPEPLCPDFELTYPLGQAKNFFIEDDRWYRVNTQTNEVEKVCEPIRPENICQEGQNPAEDHCSLPVCENAILCDPIPSLKPNEVGRSPDRANFPTYSEAVRSYFDVNDLDPIRYPIIFDNVPDCAPGETSQETYYSCDIIPTCQDTFQYCDPLPRCQPGESPISCSKESVIFGSQSECENYMNDVRNFFALYYHLGTAPVNIAACAPLTDPNTGETYFAPPHMEVTCLPIPECQPGELALPGQLITNIECGQWGSWPSEAYAPSCDQIKSCSSQP